jgi:hypothetical protein
VREELGAEALKAIEEHVFTELKWSEEPEKR